MFAEISLRLRAEDMRQHQAALLCVVMACLYRCLPGLRTKAAGIQVDAGDIRVGNGGG